MKIKNWERVKRLKKIKGQKGLRDQKDQRTREIERQERSRIKRDWKWVERDWESREIKNESRWIENESRRIKNKSKGIKKKSRKIENMLKHCIIRAIKRSCLGTELQEWPRKIVQALNCKSNQEVLSESTWKRVLWEKVLQKKVLWALSNKSYRERSIFFSKKLCERKRGRENTDKSGLVTVKQP